MLDLAGPHCPQKIGHGTRVWLREEAYVRVLPEGLSDPPSRHGSAKCTFTGRNSGHFGGFPEKQYFVISALWERFQAKPGVERVSQMLNRPPAVRHPPPVVPFWRKSHFGLRSCPSTLTEPSKTGLFEIRVKIRVSEQSILHYCPTSPSFFSRRRPVTSRFSPISFQCRSEAYVRVTLAKENFEPSWVM